MSLINRPPAGFVIGINAVPRGTIPHKTGTNLFPRQVSYNRFVELEKEVLLPMTIFIKKVLLGICTGISFVDSTPLRACRNQRILIHN